MTIPLAYIFRQPLNYKIEISNTFRINYRLVYPALLFSVVKGSLLEDEHLVKPPKLGPPFKLQNWLNEPHPKAVPRKLEISGFLKCFFTYSSGVILSRAEWGLNPL